ncbi:hypothetical protein IV203_033675 [Nitzschia inconspicua]|uniref:Uncharacterized protein n=1 Tax=Nitzschia inconspicua TaxID=303405 RepID=A0A9K3M4L8_9STRA|nr:hypothetical protein IV203_033675 [Nitzschia inconspicua]
MTSTKKIHRKLHNDKIRKEAEERDRNCPIREHHSAAQVLPVNQVAVDAREGKSSVFDSDDAHQFAMEDEMPPEIIKLKDPPPTAPPVVEFIEWEGGIELAPIVPDFDDDAEDLDDDVDDDARSRASGTRGGPSMMKLVMQAILARLREELTRTRRRAATPPDLTMHKTGIEMGDAQISERRHRHNLDMAQRVYRDFPNVGHYDTWKMDVLQKLVEQNTGKLLFPGWACVSDYFETDESFVTVPMHTSDLHDKLLRKVQQLEEIGGYNPRLSSDVKCICKSWGVPLPFLPVIRRGECRLFSMLMLNDLQKFDDNRMAHLWIEHVNGGDIFPKLLVQLKKYHRYWERNRRIQDAMDRAKSDIELLNSYLTKSVPLELEAGYNVDDTAGDAIAELDGEVGLGGRKTGNDLGREHQHVEVRPPAQHRNAVGNSNMVSLSLQELMLRNQMAMFASYMRRNLQAPNFPAAMPLPLLVNRKRPADALPITVAGETIAAMTGFIRDLHREKRRTRGKGKRTRQLPTCVYCRDSSDPEVRNSVKKCPGRWPRGTCQRK